ncbi:MAG: hypothetical protein ABIT76_12490 [Chthoniobacterales bacterium]
MRVRSFWQLVAFLILVPLGGLAMFRQFANKRNLASENVVSDKLAEQIADLKNAHPDYIVVGDSMLTTRMDPEPISQLSGRRFFFYARGGASSAAWYLYFKNVIVRSGVKPRAVIFIFRNQYLTWPRFRVDGLYQANLDRVRLGEDKLVTKLLLPDPPKPWDAIAWTRRWLVEPNGLFYSKNASAQFHARLENLALDFTAFGEKKDDRKAVMEKRFNLTSLRSDLAAELPAEDSSVDNSEDGRPRIFDPSPEKSFLPHIVDLADKNGTPLVFFRVKCRPGPNNITPQSEEMTAYIANLRKWMASRHCVFFDETNDASITLSMYQDGDHLSETAKPWWTNYFWQRMQPLLP